MITTVTMSQSTWAEIHSKFEAGTPNIEGAIAFGAACNYLDKIGMASIRNHEKELTGFALDKLNSIEEISIFWPSDVE